MAVIPELPGLVPNLEPLEDARMKSLGRPCSLISKILLLQWERPGRITVILLEDPIGF
jgi:hypothetical protein